MNESKMEYRGSKSTKQVPARYDSPPRLGVGNEKNRAAPALRAGGGFAGNKL